MQAMNRFKQFRDKGRIAEVEQDVEELHDDFNEDEVLRDIG